MPKNFGIYFFFLFCVAGFLFLWFQVRPSEIRKSCFARVYHQENEDSVSRKEYTYRLCIMSEGMKAEGLK